MEIIFEVIIQILAETIGQILFELLAEFGIRSISNALGFKKPKNPLLAAFGYIILGGVAAAISLYVFPSHFVKSANLRIVNLVLTPIAVGLFMGIRGKTLLKNHKEPIRIDSFLYGYLFALTFAAIRLFFVQ